MVRRLLRQISRMILRHLGLIMVSPFPRPSITIASLPLAAMFSASRSSTTSTTASFVGSDIAIKAANSLGSRAATSAPLSMDARTVARLLPPRSSSISPTYWPLPMRATTNSSPLGARTCTSTSPSVMM